MHIKSVIAIAIAVAGLTCGVRVFAASFCVATADELTAALSTAQQDTVSTDEIRIRTGHYAAPAGGWHVDIAQRGIVIVGGFTDAGCTVESQDASLTVLDGHQEVRPLTIDTSFVFLQNPPLQNIIVRGLTFENGLGGQVGGLKISDAGPIYPGTILVERNIFRDNVGTNYQQDNSAGALLAATDGPDFSGNVFLIVRGNLFAGNRAPDGAAALLFSNNRIDVANNTVSGNQSFDDTLTKRTAFATFTLSGIAYSNNIFWANNPDGLDGTFDLRGDNPFRADTGAELLNNDLQAVSGTPKVDSGNKAIDPAFVDAAAGNFRLVDVSSLVDAGLDAPEGGLTDFDLDGAPRAQGLHVDMGAYEASSDPIFANGFD
jgi:hypothetical protein